MISVNVEDKCFTLISSKSENKLIPHQKHALVDANNYL